MGQAATDPELGAIATSCILIATPRRGNRENELHIGAERSVLRVMDSMASMVKCFAVPCSEQGATEHPCPYRS
jgi:hypothetical protein